MTKELNKEASKIECAARVLSSSIIEYPKDLRISVEKLSASFSVVARVHASDHGKMLGTSARMFKAFKAILGRIGERNFDCAVHYVLENPVSGHMGELRPFIPRRDWRSVDNTKLTSPLYDIVALIDPSMKWKVVWDNVSDSATAITVLSLMEIDEDLREALSTWMHAVGRTSGRIIFLDFKCTPNYDREKSKQSLSD